MELPARYRDIVWPLIEAAKRFLEAGESLAPLAVVGNFTTGRMQPVAIHTRDEAAKDDSAQAIRRIAAELDADFVFVVLEGWGLPPEKLAQHRQIIDRYGSVGASPWTIDTANFVLETCHGMWMAQVPLRFEAPSQRRRTFAAAVELRKADIAAGRFGALLRQGRRHAALAA